MCKLKMVDALSSTILGRPINMTVAEALKRIVPVVLVMGVLGARALAQCPSGSEEFMVGAVGTVVPIGPTSPCNDPGTLPSVWSFWSNPNVYEAVLPNGKSVLRWSAQANRPVSGSCPGETGIDRWFSATYDPATSTWTPPSASACADLQGSYDRLPYSPTNHGPLGDSDVIRVGGKYYMAFNGGNADFIVGQVYWATSATGLPGSWNIYNASGSQPWIPLIRDRYHDGRDGIPEPPGPSNWRYPGGFTETYLAYDPTASASAPMGYFYLYLGHYGLRQESDTNGSPLDAGLAEIDSWAVRIPYDPSNTYGLSSQKEIWYLGNWTEFDSGQLVWLFDLEDHPEGNPIPGEPIVELWQGQNGTHSFFPGGGGALRQDPVTGQWLHLYWFTEPSDAYKSQRATSLAANYWTQPVSVCRETLETLIPNPPPHPNMYEPGLHHGIQGNRTGWWIFSPVNYLRCAAVYIGAGIVPAELCTTALPTISAVSPTSGTNGYALTITGTGLDCASSVKFGGVEAATIQSRAAGLLNVTAPNHSPGPVDVVVTTPSGSATKVNGFTYLPVVTIAATDSSAAESPLNTGQFTLTRTGATTSALTVTVTIGGAAPTATNGTDYTSISTSQTIAAGQASKVITVTPINDTVVESVENVTLTVASGAGYAVGSPSSATVTISSEDVGTMVSIAATDATAAESPLNTGQFTLTRTGSTAASLAVTVTVGGAAPTAANGTDYTLISTSQTIAAGQASKIITVSPVNDTAVEPLENVSLTVVAGAGYTVGAPASATVTIASEDFTPCVPSATTLCLVGGRFQATLTATTTGGVAKTGKAITYSASDKAGWFWLFSAQLPEEGVKILDNGLGGYSVTYGASTDSSTVLSVTDLSVPGASPVTFSKPLSTYCGGSVAQAFSFELPSEVEGPEAIPSVAAAFTCTPNATTACLLGNRFQVRVKVSGVAKTTTSVTSQSASFRLATAIEPDVWVNLFDGTTLNGKYWVYFGSLTNQAYTVEVTDSTTSIVKTYTRNSGTEAWCGGGDNLAF